MKRVLCAAFAPILIGGVLAQGENEPATVDDEGTVYLPPLTIPLSSLMSPQARAGTAEYFHFLQTPAARILALAPGDKTIAEQRKIFADHYRPILDRAEELYPTESTPATIAGVQTDVITPKHGIAKENKNRVLINLHGGGFTMGARIIGALESVPVASLGKIKVITLDYRQGPEHKFPAASEDVTDVYRELLKTYKPANIGIYGCSAGGMLTAEAVAWIAKEKLPAPGAIGIFCASAAGWSGGDSGYLAMPLMGMRVPMAQPASLRHPSVSDVAYFSDADFNDPLVAPIRSAAVLAKFPPTLLLTSTRDVAMSSAVHTHGQLIKLGVEADLHVWEGLPHGFFTFEPDFPESREAWDVTVQFFDKHLGVE